MRDMYDFENERKRLSQQDTTRYIYIQIVMLQKLNLYPMFAKIEM
jgi:hypothetical protein